MTLARVAVLLGRYPEDRYSVNRGYLDGLAALDVLPVLVPGGPGFGPDRALELIAGVRGVVLTGGGDVHPAHYGEEAHPALMELDADRDAVDLAVTAMALDEGLPVLGICRGIQLLAVALGGRLVADLTAAGYEDHWQEVRQHEPVHAVDAEPGSAAARALGGADLVNSIHHQAVADPGPRLRATAWSADGVIEAVEADGVLGVQWHPERLLGTDSRHLAPFRWLVAA